MSTPSSAEAARASRVGSLGSILRSHYSPVGGFGFGPDDLVRAICALGEATASVASIMREHVKTDKAGTTNSSGDDQLKLDIECDGAVFDAIRESGVYAVAASEETPTETDVSPSAGDGRFSVGFDPLDGSSIIDANFTVGGIYGVWPGTRLLGRTGREQVAAAISLYGPRTTLVVGLPEPTPRAFEVTLVNGGTEWELSRDDIRLKPSGKVFAPGNLRASNDNAKYAALINHWIEERYTLRYTGGMVPDVCHMFAKSKGVFSNVSSEKARAKLRLLYEVAPIGLVVECAGGETTHEAYDRSVLEERIDDLDKRLGVCFGSKEEVAIYKKFMFGEGS